MSAADRSISQLPVKDVLIVGGGIGGLSSAIALGRHGISATVVERDGRTIGANIGIGYRALYAAQELGFLERLMKVGRCFLVGQEAHYWGVYDADGEPIPAGPTPRLSEDWALPVIGVQLLRPQLAEIMTEAARERRAELLIGHSYQSLEPQDDGVEVQLTTGEKRHFDLVIGADGVHSDLRARFFPESAETRYLGITACRVVFENAPEHWRRGKHIAPDGSRRLVTHFYPGGEYHVGVGQRIDRRHLEQDEARALVRESLEPFVGSAPMFDEMYERLTDDVPVIVTPLESAYVPPPWHRGRVVLLGDAAHAGPPGLGMGGGMALEDSVVLAQELARFDDVDAALTAYAARRDERTRLVVETSAAMPLLDPSDVAKRHEMRRDTIQRLIAAY